MVSFQEVHPLLEFSSASSPNVISYFHRVPLDFVQTSVISFIIKNTQTNFHHCYKVHYPCYIIYTSINDLAKGLGKYLMLKCPRQIAILRLMVSYKPCFITGKNDPLKITKLSVKCKTIKLSEDRRKSR